MKRRDEFLVGIFTTAAVLIGGVGTVWLVRGGLSPGYPLYSRFPWGAGAKEGQPVWLVGVSVGFIDKLELDPSGSVVVAMRIEKKYKVPKGTTAALVANGIFGEQAVALQPAGPNPQTFAAGDTVPTRKAGVGLELLAQRADTISAGISSLTNALRSEFVDSGGMRETRQTLAAINRLARQFSQIADAQSRALESTLAAARARLTAIDSADVDSTVRSMRQAAANLTALTVQMQTATTRVNALLAKVDSGGGAASRLLNDRAMYDSVTKLLGTVQGLLVEFQKNPRKFINLKIF